MKKSITILALLAGAVGVNAQSILMGDYIGVFGITVYAPNPANPALEQTGNTSYDLSAGTGGDTHNANPNTVYGGVALGGSATGSGTAAYGNGNLFTVALMAAPGANAVSGFTQIGSSLFNASGGSGTANAGTDGNSSAGMWQIGNNYPVSYTGSVPVTLELVAWYNGNGSLSNPTYTYATSPETGVSTAESVSTVGGIGSPPSVEYNLGQELIPGDGIIQSFSLTAVPEPSTIALGVIGASTFLFRRRK